MACKPALMLLLAACVSGADLRIGVLGLFRPERVSVRSTQPLIIHAGSRAFTLNPGQVAGLRAVDAVIDTFAQHQMTSSPRVAVSGPGGAPVAFRLSIDGKIDRNFTGKLEVVAVGSRLEPVILVDLESAVAAVVAAEMTEDAPAEALKAMAVLARSYYVASGRRHGAYDFCDTTHCQWRRETIANAHPTAKAARATKGIVVTYDNRPFPAMYHASCGGRTKDASGIGLSPEPYPYFPVDCDSCRRAALLWQRRLTHDAAAFVLGSPSEAKRLDLNRRIASDALPSNTYEARDNGSDIIVAGRGSGHGLGVCQFGMSALAKAGQDFRAILSRYLPQTRTAVP